MSNRFPLEPLTTHLGIDMTPHAHLHHRGGYQALAEATGIDRRHLRRLATDGLPEHLADRAAIAVGVHPSTIWGDLWWNSLTQPHDLADSA